MSVASLKRHFTVLCLVQNSYLKLNKNQIRDSVRIVDVKLRKKVVIKGA